MKFIASLLFISLTLICNAAIPFPTKPIKIVVGYAPGGGMDLNARIFARYLSETINSSVVVENRGGAGGAVAAAYVKSVAADGHTILYVGTDISSLEGFMRDFTSIGYGGDAAPLVLLASSRLKINNFKDLKQYTNSNVINYGTPGIGSAHHVYLELLMNNIKANSIHIPFRGSAPSIAALISGDIDVVFSSPATIPSLISSKKVHPIAVLGSERLDSLPDIHPLNTLVTGTFPRDLKQSFVFYVKSDTPTYVKEALSNSFSRSFRLSYPDLVSHGLIDARSAVPLNINNFGIKEGTEWIFVKNKLKIK